LQRLAIILRRVLTQEGFELFRRAGQQDVPGEGIGLAYVRQLAYRLGGTITLESTFGQGTIFKLKLPLAGTRTQKDAA